MLTVAERNTAIEQRLPKIQAHVRAYMNERAVPEFVSREDATQEVVARLCGWLDRHYDPKLFGLDEYVYKRTEHAIRMFLRSAKMDTCAQPPSDGFSDENPPAWATDDDWSAACKDASKAVGGLLDPHRSAAILYYWRGLRTSEVADNLDLPKGTVWRLLHEARKIILENLEGLGYPDAIQLVKAEKKRKGRPVATIPFSRAEADTRAGA